MKEELKKPCIMECGSMVSKKSKTGLCKCCYKKKRQLENLSDYGKMSEQERRYYILTGLRFKL
jgi:hypothetical protein